MAVCSTENFPTAVCPTENFPTAVCPTENYTTELCPTENCPTEICPTENGPTAVCPTTLDKMPALVFAHWQQSNLYRNDSFFYIKSSVHWLVHFSF
jgi:hypothetical protein